MRKSFLTVLMGCTALSLYAGPAIAWTCPSPIHPPCCPSPCPVTDAANNNNWSDIMNDTWMAADVIGFATDDQRDYPGSEVTSTDVQLANLMLGRQWMLGFIEGPEDHDPPDLAALDLTGPVIPEREFDDDDLPDIKIDPDRAEDEDYLSMAEIRVLVDGTYVTNSADPNSAALKAKQEERLLNRKPTAINNYAAALHRRHNLAKFKGEHEKLVDMVNEASNLRDEIRVNSFVRLAVIDEFVKFANLLESDNETRASTRYMNAAVHNEEPIGALTTVDTTVEPVANTGITIPTQGGQSVGGVPNPGADILTPEDIADLPAESSLLEQIISELLRVVRVIHSEMTGIRGDYNSNLATENLRNLQPDLMVTVDEHEQFKQDLWLIETALRNALHDYNRITGDNVTWGQFEQLMLSRDGTQWVDSGTRWSEAINAAYTLAPPFDAAYMQQYQDQASGTGLFPSYTPPTTGIRPLQAAITLKNRWSGNDLHRYRIELIRPAFGDEDPEYYPDFFLGIQFYLEAHKRKQHWDNLRRGFAIHNDYMSGRMWDELVRSHRDCLVAPASPTDQNLVDHPEYFDVSPDCAPREWQPGAPVDLVGRPITSEELGGTDRAIWSSTMSILSNEARNPSPSENIQDAERLIQAIEDQRIIDYLEAAGRTEEADEVRAALATLRLIQAGNAAGFLGR